MKAWIGNLAAYNNGHLTGEWVAITDDADVMAAAIHRICGDVEHYVADYQDVPGAIVRKLGEYANADALAQAAALINAINADHAEDVATGILDSYVADNGDDLETMADGVADWVADNFLGQWDSLIAYAENYLDETGALDAIPEDLRGYFDVQAYARDLRHSGEVFTRETASGVLVFRA